MQTTTLILRGFYQTYFHIKKESSQFYFIMSWKTLAMVRLMKVEFIEHHTAGVPSLSCTIKVLL